MLNVADELLVLKAEGYKPLEVFLPRPVNRHSVTCTFNPSTMMLNVVMGVASIEPNHLSADQGSKAWLLAEALSMSDDQPKQQNLRNVAPDEEEELEFPEDAFHKTDVVSQYYLDEKKQALKRQKEKQAEKDRIREEKIAKVYVVLLK